MPMKRPIRVLHVVGAMNHGGIETWLLRMLRRMDPATFANDLLLHTNEECAYDEEVRQLGAGILRCPHVRRPWRYGTEFKRIVRANGPYDVVHSHVYLFSGFVLRLAATMGIPTRIAHVHPCVDQKQDRLFRGVYRRFMTQWISRHATCVVSPSDSSLAAFKAICDTRHLHTGVVPNAVEIERFERPLDRNVARRKHALPIDKPIILYVARFAPHKNHDQFLRIADRMNRDGGRFHFVLVGSGGPLMQDIRRNVLSRRDVTLVTDLTDVSEILRASDLFLFPSLNEGFGVVAIEAAAAGLPVVATDLPTIREACAPSMHPFSFPPNDDAKAMDSIRTILADETLHARLSAEGREFAKRFSLERSLRELTGLYAALADRAA
jgi:glycosyltransferase involved in cell wall biosynthesis